MMSEPNSREHAQLLARARAALEIPVHFEGRAIAQIIEDLRSAEDRLERHIVPWSIDVHVAEIDHRHGTNIYVALTREALMLQVAAFCRECWSEIEDDRDPWLLPDEEVAAIYFDLHAEEFLSTDRISCDPGTVAPDRSTYIAEDLSSRS